MSFPSPISEKEPVFNIQKRKRPNTYDSIQGSLPAKRIKSSSVVGKVSNFPPKFWDNLSKVWLTPRALRELDRRKDAQPRTAISAALITATPTNLARFARRGGPDLCHLRGCPEPTHAAQMPSNGTSESSSRRTRTTKATRVTSRKRSSAYDNNFEQDLIDHNIYPRGFPYPDDDSVPEPSNFDDIVQAIAAPRASLSPSRVSRGTFRKFCLMNERIKSEGNVMAKILPKVLGDADIPSEGNLPFTNFDSITDGTTVDAVPDLFDGSHPKDIHERIKQELSDMIIPTKHSLVPVVPNFFMEAKAPRGGADIARRQACLDGAVGARAMHNLQNYGEEKPVYDGNAHTYSSTYHNGLLMLYAHHVTGPTDEGEKAEYHMTQLKGYALTGDRETFVTGATAFRNARDLARRQRERLIREANARALQTRELAAGEHLIEESDDSHPSDGNAWQAIHDDLQQQICETYTEVQEDSGPTTPTHQYTSDDSQDPSRDPGASGTNDPSSLTPESSTDTTRPKRARHSFSSPTLGSRLSKSRSRATAAQRSARSPTTGETES
ncbi:hypothetical protein A9K55_007579 [Cordyceps militaris]|uniref:DUF7924 domain-containing protein n=1 Tax=Cordyceps militaris TaxID=73501 RepID=A0A2H4SHH9_CORMI|nr:hypothetical protein A9K55_007579 [Cordyceps militaris]